jgi:hypothetical protein
VIFFGANTLNFRACSSGKSLLDAILSNGSQLRLHRGRCKRPPRALERRFPSCFPAVFCPIPKDPGALILQARDVATRRRNRVSGLESGGMFPSAHHKTL